MVYKRTDLGRGANDDVTFTDVSRRGEMIMRMVNIFDQRVTQSGERLARKLS